MTDTPEDKAAPHPMTHVGVSAAGGLVGFIAGFFTHRATELPIDALDWAIKNGVTGIALAVAFVFAWVAWQTLKSKARLEEKYAQKVETLMREQVVLARRTAKLLTLCVEVLKGATISLDEIEEAEREVDGNGEGDSSHEHSPK